jgi:hypothetical protein
MSILNWFRRPITVRQVAVWAVEVARRSHPEVTLRLRQGAYEMSLIEARGYIRARSATVLDAEIGLLQRQTGCTVERAATVRRRALEEIIRLVIGDILRATRQAPMLRRAA